jgi:hypothetical protein
MMHRRLNARGAYERAKIEARRRGAPLRGTFDEWVARQCAELGPGWVVKLRAKQRQEEAVR